MFKALKFDSVNTVINSVLTFAGIVVSVICLILTLSPQAEQASIFKKLLDLNFVISIVILSLLVIYVCIYRYKLIGKKIATEYVLPQNRDVIFEHELTEIKVKGIKNEVSSNCLNRLSGERINKDFWQSSWFGAGVEIDSPTGFVDTINSTPVHEGTTITGKVPVIKEAFFDKHVHALNMRFEHKPGGFWCAVIHGHKGKPNFGIWKTKTLNLLDSTTISFWAKSYDFSVLPVKDDDNPYGLPLLYVRFEDTSNVTSNSVIIKVPSSWEQFEIPLNKFIYNPDLYQDYNRYVVKEYLKNRRDFKPEKVMQIMCGLTGDMQAQTGGILIYDIRLT